MALKRHLGSADVFGVAAGTMISSGLFVLPGIVFAKDGPSVFIAYLIASLLLIPTVLTKAELATAMPKAGGVYFHIDRSLGAGLGMLAGIAAWASLSFKSAFALLGIGALANFVWAGTISSVHIKFIAAGFCVILTVVNLVSVRHAGRLQLFTVIALCLVLFGYSVVGITKLEPSHFEVMLPNGWLSLLQGTAMVFVSFGGIMKATTLGEEVNNPKKDLIKGMAAAAIGVSALYGLVTFATVGVVDPESLRNSLAPLSLGAQSMWGWSGAIALSLAGLMAFLTAGNAGLLSASRTVMAMGRNGHLPPALSKVSKKRGTPVNATVFTSVLMIGSILFLNLKLFVKAASAMTILLFMFSMISLIMMRESRLPSYRPSWRCPFYPWTQVLGLGCYFFLLVELGTIPLFLAALLLGGGFVYYRLFVTVREVRESALNHLAERVAAADFPEHDLEAELSRIARERDGQEHDRFDRLIQECPIIDAENGTTQEEMFEEAAQKLADNVNKPAEEIHELLSRREQLSSTVIRPGFAVPHSFNESIEHFGLVIVRSLEGIEFADAEEPVRAIFVLVGPPEERNFYLQSLMAIAEIANDVSFDEKWEKARGPEALREMILNAERRREFESERDESTA